MLKRIFLVFCKGFHELGSVTAFAALSTRTLLTTKGNLRPILDQVTQVSLRSLSTIIFAGIFVGAILVLQLDLILQRYEARTLLGGLNTSTVVREVGPLIISFLLAGKIGAFTTAELGTMRVTEQIDAIECLGVDPVQYLIVPRLFGIIISSMILLMIGLFISMTGSMVVAGLVSGLNIFEFGRSIPKFVSASAFLGAGVRSLVYGSIVATVACHRGYTTHGGARGVGNAVTLSAFYTNFYILIANFLLTEFLNSSWKISQELQGIIP